MCPLPRPGCRRRSQTFAWPLPDCARADTADRYACQPFGSFVLWLAIEAGLTAWLVSDLIQLKHAILRNFPVIGHFRYWLEDVGPELRQYIVTGNDEELPFSRDQRRWVYASSKRENNYFGFGSDNDME